MKKMFFVFCVLLSFFFTSCFLDKFVSVFLNREKEIALEDSDALALAVDVEWAVVTEPYATFKTDKEWNSGDRSHAKQGEVLKVIGISVSSEKEKWILFNEGYLPAKSVSIFTNKYQADKLSRDLSNR